jgi:hypothetical protein
MKYWYVNLVLVAFSVMSGNAAFLFSLFILITAAFQLFFVPAMFRHRRQLGSWYRTMLLCYSVTATISVLIFSVSVYYLNVKPSLFRSFESTGEALLFFQRFLILPALIHLLLHRSLAAGKRIKPNKA